MRQRKLIDTTKSKWHKITFSLTPGEYQDFELLYKELHARKIIHSKKGLLMALVYLGLQKVGDKEFWKEATTATWKI